MAKSNSKARIRKTNNSSSRTSPKLPKKTTSKQTSVTQARMRQRVQRYITNMTGGIFQGLVEIAGRFQRGFRGRIEGVALQISVDQDSNSSVATFYTGIASDSTEATSIASEASRRALPDPEGSSNSQVQDGPQGSNSDHVDNKTQLYDYGEFRASIPSEDQEQDPDMLMAEVVELV